jgi:hypothetical protein
MKGKTQCLEKVDRSEEKRVLETAFGKIAINQQLLE